MKYWMKKEVLNAVLKAGATLLSEISKVLSNATTLNSDCGVSEVKLEKDGKGAFIEVDTRDVD